MNRAMVDRLVHALLYEGYILYPYRPSVKNRHRWTFGGLYPRAWSEAQMGSDLWTMQTECLLETQPDAAVQIAIRFLHLIDRTIGEVEAAADGGFRAVESLTVGQREYRPWQEAAERSIDLGEIPVAQIVARPMRKAFSFPAERKLEEIRTADSAVAGMIVRDQRAISGEMEISGTAVAGDLVRITVRIMNLTQCDSAIRDEALLHSLVSTHTVLGASGGAFVSLADPPEKWREQAADCKNIGAWPILVGQEGERDTVLSSPIILCDYPEIAPESPGDLFDSGEIDEILTLRIMTLTDDEKRSAAGNDDRVRELLARTDSLARDQLMSLHGAVRGLRPRAREAGNE